jgi:hypothetical protein
MRTVTEPGKCAAADREHVVRVDAVESRGRGLSIHRLRKGSMSGASRLSFAQAPTSMRSSKGR